MSNTPNPGLNLPGRLGDPAMNMATDPRLDSRIRQMFLALADGSSSLEPISPDAPIDQCLEWCLGFEQASEKQNEMLFSSMPSFDDVECWTELITGQDGNQITLFVHRQKEQEGLLPCVLHLHGGGMALTSATDPIYVRWRNELARSGCLTIGVEFRNAAGRLGNHPFPAGLNDCASALNWVNRERTRLGISSLSISGESGGGNLALATAIKALKEGWAEQIEGVFALCPDISCKYLDADPQLLSLKENEGYMVDTGFLGRLLSRVYDPSGENARNPLAWPYYAETQDLKGLPQHFISVNELDPLRDEGLAYFRKLGAAGVSVVGRVVAGTPHGTDVGLPDVVPNVFRATIDSILAFVKGLERDTR